MFYKLKHFKFILIFTILISSVSYLSGASPKNFNLDFQVGLDSNFFKYSEHEDYGVYAICNFSNKKFNMRTGLRIDQLKTDLFSEAIFVPHYFKTYKLGIITTGHFYQYRDLFYEIDFLPGVYYETIKDDCFTFKLIFTYCGKYSVIHSIKDAKPFLPTNSMGVVFSFNWDFNYCSIFVDLRTYDCFDYPIFCSPILIAGLEKNVLCRFTIGAKVVSEWIDMFTIEASPTVMTVSTYVKVGL